MSDTPRVDLAAFRIPHTSDSVVTVEFSRHLERELAAKTKEYDELKAGIPTWREML